MRCGKRAAPARALACASRKAVSAGASPGSGVSSTLGEQHFERQAQPREQFAAVDARSKRAPA